MLLVDAANVVGSRPNGWWRDRAGAARDLVQQLRLATSLGRLQAPVVVVLEGAAKKGVHEGTADGVQVVHAPGEGDDTLADLAAETGATGEHVRLVSADRGLSARVRTVGGESVGPRWLLDLMADTPR